MPETVLEHLHLTKRELAEASGEGHILQTGAIVLDDSFAVPRIDPSLVPALPSIETFVVSGHDRSIAAMGSNQPLNDAWMPTVEALAGVVFRSLDEHQVMVAGDAYITASITPASDVNDQAHFDDDQFNPDDGVGVVAIVADLDGSRVATGTVALEQIRPPLPLTLDERTIESFSAGTIERAAFGPHTVVLFPQFGQLHSGPGPCGGATDVRHLLVLRAATAP